MSELERLDGALEWLDHQPRAEAYTAAKELRAYRNLLANGERVEWCETHDSPQHGGREHCQAWYLPSTDVDQWCSFGGRLLVDPPKEEEGDIVGLTMRTNYAKITDMSMCTEPNCQATFFYVAERQHPTLCIEHADEASRDRGWTPENSHD